jgi:ADP-heptose:LPS heptosyltransferase
VKILVISLAGIGDTLFATPLIHELRVNFPDAIIDALVLWRGAKSLLENNPHLNAVHQQNLMVETKTGSLKFLWKRRRAGYDATLNTFPQSRRHYRLVAKFINAPLRLSHAYEGSGRLDGWLVNKTLPPDGSQHAVENNLALLAPLGAKPKLPAHRYEIYLTAKEEAWAADFIAQHRLAGRPLLGIHVGSGGTKNLALRRWPLASYIELVRRVRQSRPDVRVLFFGGPEEKIDHEKIQVLTGDGDLLFPQSENLRQAAALIGKCAAFLSVDTALMHVAAAMQVRGQIVIETPTWNRPIEPYANPFTLVKNPAVAGRNLEFYRYDGGAIKGTNAELTACMTSVSVADVFAKVMEKLAAAI